MLGKFLTQLYTYICAILIYSLAAGDLPKKRLKKDEQFNSPENIPYISYEILR